MQPDKLLASTGLTVHHWKNKNKLLFDHENKKWYFACEKHDHPTSILFFPNDNEITRYKGIDK